ncbi:MAG TPA: hypothetical protein PK460_04410 [Bacilli bacterium]|nr:hypothetical protein [Bacilli bacterium]
MLAIRFADFYNVSLDYLFGRSERQLQISEKDIENLSEQDKNEMLAFIIKLINEKK